MRAARARSWKGTALGDACLSVAIVCLLCGARAQTGADLVFPLNTATDFVFTGFGFGQCEFVGPVTGLPRARYIPPDATRVVEDLPGVALPVASFSFSGQECSLAPGAELFLDNVQPPEALNVTQATVFSQALANISGFAELSYILVLQSTDPEGPPACAAPPDRTGLLSIRSTVHLEFSAPRTFVGLDPSLQITFLPGVRYAGVFFVIANEPEEPAFCMFRNIDVVRETPAPSSVPSIPSIPSEDTSESGLSAAAIVAIIAGSLIVLTAVIAVVAVKKCLWNAPVARQTTNVEWGDLSRNGHVAAGGAPPFEDNEDSFRQDNDRE